MSNQGHCAFIGLCIIDNVLLDSGAVRPRGLLFLSSTLRNDSCSFLGEPEHDVHRSVYASAIICVYYVIYQAPSHFFQMILLVVGLPSNRLV